jgi:hypothetical protein
MHISVGLFLLGSLLVCIWCPHVEVNMQLYMQAKSMQLAGDAGFRAGLFLDREQPIALTCGPNNEQRLGLTIVFLIFLICFCIIHHITLYGKLSSYLQILTH